MLVADCVSHCTFARDYLGVVLDPAHLAAEATWEAVTIAVGYLVLKPLVRRWQEREHLRIDIEHGVDHHKVHEHKFEVAHMLTSNPPIAVSRCECGETRSVRLA